MRMLTDPLELVLDGLVVGDHRELVEVYERLFQQRVVADRSSIAAAGQASQPAAEDSSTVTTLIPTEAAGCDLKRWDTSGCPCW